MPIIGVSKSFPPTPYYINANIVPENKRKELKNVIETVLCHDLEVEQDLALMILFREVTSNNGIDDLVTLPKE